MKSMMASVKVNAASYRGDGFISKAFKIEHYGTVTGSVLYQKNYNLTSDRVNWTAITTNNMTVDYKLYKNEDLVKKGTIPLGDKNKVNLTKKISKTYSYAKIRLETPGGVYVLYADE